MSNERHKQLDKIPDSELRGYCIRLLDELERIKFDSVERKRSFEKWNWLKNITMAVAGFLLGILSRLLLGR